MPRRKVDLIIGEYYHIYNRGANREAIFFERDHYLFFLRRFSEKLGLRDISNSKSAEHWLEPSVTVLAYCLMPNHYHFLVRLESEMFSKGMQAFGTSFSKAINKQMVRVGPLFQGRFQAKHVDDESYLVHLSRYIHLNPLKAQLVEVASAWEFSSYPEYLGTRDGQLPDIEILMREFQSRKRYCEFVESQTATEENAIEHLLFQED